jgi:LPS-assembly protein
MRKIWLVSVLLPLMLWAQESGTWNDIQILAGSIERQGTKVTAEEDVLLLYKEALLQADHVVYDLNNSVVELFGHVTAMNADDYATMGDYAKLDLKHEKESFKKFFMAGFETPVWLRGERADRDHDKMTLQKAFVSSCDLGCPDWHIEYSSAEYNTTTQWLDIWNPIFYIGDKPVFYLPYIASSLNKKRKSGLLRPTVGLSDRDGFTLVQPIYFAPQPWWDLQIDPQVRLNRGAGAYATLRFVDSPQSYGEIRAGYFKTQSDYAERYSLRNRSHYGVEAHYEAARLFTQEPTPYQDGLYVDAIWLNDPDYINLQSSSLVELAESSQANSRVNYFFSSPSYYAGVYGRYYIDTLLTREDRKKTLQTLPSVQLHAYQAPLFGLENFLYSLDYRVSNYIAETGRNIQFQEIDLPLSFYGSLFDDYIRFSISENLYYSYSAYKHFDDSALLLRQNRSDSYSLFRNYHQIEVHTDLAKGYGTLFHTMRLKLEYDKPSFSSESGHIDPTISVLRSPREQLIASWSHYLYDEAGQEFLYYRLAQPIYYEPLNEFDRVYHRYGDIEQEVRYRFGEHYELYSDFFYSYYLHNFSDAITSLSVDYPVARLGLHHFFKQQIDLDMTSDDFGEMVKTSNFFRFDALYRYDESTDYYGHVSYDALNDKVNRWGLGVRLYRKCWNLDMGVRDEMVPILSSSTENPADSIHNISFYFTIGLVPFGDYSQTLSQEL